MSPPFRHRFRVRYAECDPQGVVFNSHYLAYADLVLTELWREALDGGYGGMVSAGADVVVAEATVRFRAPARFDDWVDAEAEVTRLGTTGMSMSVRMLRGDELLSEVEIRHVFVATDGSGKILVPDAVRRGLGAHLADSADEPVTR
ncbi:MAG: thioesterase family protein [Thermoleophilaceae bacterium]